LPLSGRKKCGNVTPRPDERKRDGRLDLQIASIARTGEKMK
jgi:hypothetical protein